MFNGTLVMVAVLAGALLLGSSNVLAADGDTFFAAVGVWKGPVPAENVRLAKPDPLAAAEAATKDMLAKFQEAGQKPVAVVFLDRVTNTQPGDGKAIGDKVRQTAGVPTFGHGGPGTYAIAFTDAVDNQPTFLVLGLSGKGLKVNGYAVGGKIQYTYPDGNLRKEAEAGDEEAKAKWDDWSARNDDLRAACKSRGLALGKQVVKADKPAFAIILGALHNNWHVTFGEGFVEALGENAMPLAGGVGKWDDYVYNDGKPFTDADGKPTAVGQLAVIVSGDIAIAAATKESKNTFNKRLVDSDSKAVADKALKALGDAKPQLVLAFSCVTRLRDAKTMDPAKEYEVAQMLFGKTTPIFGCFCGGEMGLDFDGKYDAGGNRLAVIAVAGKQASK